MEANLRSICI